MAKSLLRIAILVSLALGAAPSPQARAGEAPAPMDILRHALAVWNSHPTPPVIDYDVKLRGAKKHGDFSLDMHVNYIVPERTYSSTVSAASGRIPMGVRVDRPRLLPDETFGLVPRVRSNTKDPAPEATDSSIRTVATVRVVTQCPYDVSLVGIDPRDGGAAYHLHFEPRSDPDAHPVREVWIDTDNFDVLKIVAYQCERAGIVRVPYLLSVNYRSAGPYWLVQSGEAGATARMFFFTVSASGRATYANYEFPEAPLGN